jgi:hypothetical protein
MILIRLRNMNDIAGVLVSCSLFAWFAVFCAKRSAAPLAVLADGFRFGFALGESAKSAQGLGR